MILPGEFLMNSTEDGTRKFVPLTRNKGHCSIANEVIGWFDPEETCLVICTVNHYRKENDYLLLTSRGILGWFRTEALTCQMITRNATKIEST